MRDLVGEHAGRARPVVGGEGPAHEVGAPAAEDPRRCAPSSTSAAWAASSCSPPSFERPYSESGRARGPLVVGARRRAVEDVVGGDVHDVGVEPGGRRGQGAHAQGVHREGLLRVALAPVDIGERRRR